VTPHVLFVVESGTDRRLIEGLSARWPLVVLARRILGGREISQPTEASFELQIASPSVARFAVTVMAAIVRERQRCGAVLVQGYGLAALAANVAGRIAGVPVLMLVCSPTEIYYRCRAVDRSGKRFKRLEWIALRGVAWMNARLGRGYIVLGPYLASIVRGHGACCPVTVAPIYGVDTTVFCPSAEPRATVRERLGLPVDAALVFFSSRIAPEKDPDALLAAVAALRGTGRDVRVLHRSGGHDAFVRRAAAHGIADVVLAGPAVPPGPELADYYRASDVCVQASRAEGLGFSPLEALACGVPVIASSVGGLRDTIEDGRTGWTVPPGDPVALAAAVADALDRPGEARRRVEEGRALVSRSYERRVAFAAAHAAIAAVVGGRPLPREARPGPHDGHPQDLTRAGQDTAGRMTHTTQTTDRACGAIRPGTVR
jgi:glycosyltransferase involved in cell wall biosynthesis